MATKLTSELTRETTVVVEGREVQITLTENQTIFMKLKGMKSGGVEISIDALYQQLKGGIPSAKSGSVTLPTGGRKRSEADSGDVKISLHDLRHRANIMALEYPILSKIDNLFHTIIAERKEDAEQNAILAKGAPQKSEEEETEDAEAN